MYFAAHFRTRVRAGALAVITLLLAGLSSASAQYELRSGVYNYISGRVPISNPTNITPVGPATAPSGSPAITPQFSVVAESSGGSVMTNGTSSYPTSTAVKLKRSSFGMSFASGVPRYSLGNIIPPPLTIINSSGTPRTVDASFWRPKPVQNGETINNPSAQACVDYRSNTSALLPALGAGERPSVYYSPHAKRVFANTSGQCSVTWVSAAPENNNYIFYKETFSVSSVASTPVRNMYWTERTFTCPLVNIPSGRITIAAPVYSNVFPDSVGTEVDVPGDKGPGEPILKTLWVETNGGVKNLHAYNVTGRLLLEYLGALQADGSYEFLGMEILNVERTLDSATTDVKLGTQVLPFDGSQFDLDPALLASPLAKSVSQVSYLGTVNKADGRVDYYAERENGEADRVTFYWLEPLTLGINSSGNTQVGAVAANLPTIAWPKYLNRYTLSWPDPGLFVQYTVDEAGSTLASGTGLQFVGGKIPQIIYQEGDSPDASIDTNTQRLLVDLQTRRVASTRTLLKFIGANGGVWYVPLRTQSANSIAAITGNAYVGERINPPSADYMDAGYVASGNSYLPSAYISPFEYGAVAAGKGALIPVNALPDGGTTLKVWWFKKTPAKSAEFVDIYAPAALGTYTVGYRSNLETELQDFNTAPIVGWTDNRQAFSPLDPRNGILGPFSTYYVGGAANSSANGPATSKTFVPGLVNAEGVAFTARILRIDTWNAKSFRAYVKTATASNFDCILDQTFSSGTQVSTTTTGSYSAGGVNYLWQMAPTAGSYVNFHGNATIDQGFDVVILARPTTVAGADSLSTISLGFGSNLDSDAGAFGIEDVQLVLPPPQIVLASSRGSGTLPPGVADGVVYNQPDPSKAGYNPNEEHALILNGVAYALRDDLNVTSGTSFTGQSAFTSSKAVLIAYTDPDDGRPAVKVFSVARESSIYSFNYPVTAGTMLDSLAPMPLPLMPLPIDPTTKQSKNSEVTLTAASDLDTAPVSGAPTLYNKFTFKDRKGYTWVYRGPQDPAKTPALGMQFYYPMRADFVFPGRSTQPAAGTPLPYLRPYNGNDVTTYTGDAVTGTPITVRYLPAWPANAPTMSVAETLSLPNHGLPAVRGQSSAEVLYQQSIAVSGTTAPSVSLTDPTRRKTVLINAAGVGMTALPASLKTTIQRGKTYFQGAQPHLQNRFYFDPTLGTKGGLVLEGEFVDVLAGEDYLNLNTLSSDDVAALKGLVPSSATADRTKWEAAINNLLTTVQTFKESTSTPGTYVSDSSKDASVNGVTLPLITSSDTAVDSYALTAEGKGAGYVSLIFGNGNAFTPAGEPVSMSVIKVVPSLYKGDLKALFASNPLDEQVSLRHSGDYAAHPERYEFQWRYSLEANPAIYSNSSTTVLGTSSTNTWYVLDNPTANPSVAVPVSGYPTTPITLTSTISYPTVSGVTLTGCSTTLNSSAVSCTNTSGLVIGMRMAGTGIPVGATVTAINSIITPKVITLSANATATGTNLSVTGTNYNAASQLPPKLLKHTTGLTLTSVPTALYFSINQLDGEGFILYVNNKPALACNIPPGFPTPNDIPDSLAVTGLIPGGDGLDKQFSINPSFFSAGNNRIELALYSPQSTPSTAYALQARIHAASKADKVVESGSPWQAPSGTLTNTVVLGGSAASPLGNPLLVFSDTFFTMRYRAKAGNSMVVGSTDADWSEWAAPVFVPSWVKRVLDGINPFNQRVTDLANNAVNTDVSVLTQAGGRWEGNVALNLTNINDFGLIEIYETVLNRVKAQSIDAGVSAPSVNNTLLLAAGYLSDLYMLLGNEAADDALNPTLQIDAQGGGADITSSRFSFEGQAASVIDETITLWRGRDDTASTQVGVAPVYNRLYWNYTNGIRSGEPIYATNYNIKEKSGKGANGVINEFDAARLFPQGHGDAYGHYLTALTGYYKLLTNSNFTWSPSAENVSLAGQTVAVDYKDERKFASAAAALAKAATYSLNLTARMAYQDGSTGWSSLTERKSNSATGRTRYWGADEWANRGYLGAYFNWATANSMLPSNDTVNSGVAKIDRTTVPELNDLARSGDTILSLANGLQAGINPLGLTADSMTFDISPSAVADGKTHFDQVYERAVQAAVNAKDAFMGASRMNALLRGQSNSLEDFNESVVRQEESYQYQLLTLFGAPYNGDVGPGKLYAQDYSGPDIYHFLFIDKPYNLVDIVSEGTVTFREPTDTKPFTKWNAATLKAISEKLTNPTKYVEKTFTVPAFGTGMFATAAMGRRPQPGKIQSALLELCQAHLNVKGAVDHYQGLKDRFDRDYSLYNEMISNQKSALSGYNSAKDGAVTKMKVAADFENAAGFVSASKYAVRVPLSYLYEGVPKENGTSNDLTFTPRALAAAGLELTELAFEITAAALRAKANSLQPESEKLKAEADQFLMNNDADVAEKEHVAEFENLFNEVLGTKFAIDQRMGELQLAAQRAAQLLTEASHILTERETFRIRVAGVIQGYRTRDTVYRDMRNEQISQYASLFDLAQIYAYCAAKAYDYETGLLSSPAGNNFVKNIISNWCVGEFNGSNPIRAKLGDTGLAGVLSALRDDWSVAKGRLGMNNPDRGGTLFSLRQELFRIRTDAATADDNTLWQQVLQQRVMGNVLSDPDVQRYCSNIAKADGSAVPGIVIPFGSTIQPGLNFFGWPLAAGDHGYSQSTFATKILSAGVMFKDYVGMDAYGGTGGPASSGTNALSANPYVYLIPVGLDVLRTPPLGDVATLRTWAVKDQALPLPVNIGGSDYSSLQLFTPQGTLNEQLWIPRKSQAFRAVDNAQYFYGSMPAEYTNARLVGRSVWNTGWKLVIPAYPLLKEEQAGLDRFIKSVSDIKVFFRTYSNSGN